MVVDLTYGIHDHVLRSSVLCKMLAFISYTAYITTVAVLIVRTVDRFVAIVLIFTVERPNKNVVLLTLSAVILISLMVNVVSYPCHLLLQSEKISTGFCFNIDLTLHAPHHCQVPYWFAPVSYG